MTNYYDNCSRTFNLPATKRMIRKREMNKCLLLFALLNGIKITTTQLLHQYIAPIFWVQFQQDKENKDCLKQTGYTLQ